MSGALRLSFAGCAPHLNHTDNHPWRVAPAVWSEIRCTHRQGIQVRDLPDLRLLT